MHHPVVLLNNMYKSVNNDHLLKMMRKLNVCPITCTDRFSLRLGGCCPKRTVESISLENKIEIISLKIHLKQISAIDLFTWIKWVVSS